MEKISFKKVIDTCSKFIESHGQDKEMVELQSKLIIKNYLDMDEKVLALTRAFLDADKDVSIPSVFISVAFDLAILFDCLFSYTNINIEEIQDSDKIYENYDLIYKSGLADYIIEYCEKDYERLVKMAERSLSIEHVSQMLIGLENVDGDSIDEMTRAIIDLKNSSDKEMIHDIATIARAYDPNMEVVKDKLNDEVLDKIFSKE